MKYKTIRRSISVKQVINKSIFIGTAENVDSNEKAKEFIKGICEKYKDANHNAFAYRVGAKGDEYLYSDDGEPSKTAGLQIYYSIKSFEVTNVAVVVTRYFGGIKLGISGLIEAYGNVAKFAIESAGVVEESIRRNFFIEFPYSEMRIVQYAVDKTDAKVIKKDFYEKVVFQLEMQEERYEEFKNIILSKTSFVKFL